jgi:antitoxin (DNA-binding transcriptional repressor) of toxin-antitoxin stability system
MLVVNLSKAKSQLSRLITAIETKQQDEIIIIKDGKPVARLVGLTTSSDTSARIGIAKNAFVLSDTIDDKNEEVTALFFGDGFSKPTV